jgi:hypothetical protein
VNSQPATFSQSLAPPPVRWPQQEDPFAAQSFRAIRSDLTPGELIKNRSAYPLSHFLYSDLNAAELQPRPDPRLFNDYQLQLQQWYALVSEDCLITAALAEAPSLYRLLKEAVEPLRLAFGERKLLQLEALESDEGNILRVVVKLPFDTERPAALMRRFKQGWWLKNCSRSEASLVFDYETGNGY